MPIISTTYGNPQLTDIVSENAFPMIGTASRNTANDVVTNVDAEIEKLFEDRNVILTGGGTLTYTAGSPSTLALTANMTLEINSNSTGSTPVSVTIASGTYNFSAANHMLYAVINRTAGTSVVTGDASVLPAVTGTNQEVFVIAKRIGSGGLELLYFRNGQVYTPGQSTGLGTGFITASGTAALTNKTIDPTLNTIPLASADLLVGNGSGHAAPVAITGNVTISNTGVTTIGASQVTSAMIVDGTIVNADISGAAAIAGSKIQAVTASNAGVLTTGADTVAGLKTFDNGVTMAGGLITPFISNTPPGGIVGFSGGVVNPQGSMGEGPINNATAYSINGNTSTFTEITGQIITSGTWLFLGTIVANRQSGQQGYIGSIHVNSAAGGTEGIDQQTFDDGAAANWALQTMALFSFSNLNSSATVVLAVKDIGNGAVPGQYGGSIRCIRVG